MAAWAPLESMRGWIVVPLLSGGTVETRPFRRYSYLLELLYPDGTSHWGSEEYFEEDAVHGSSPLSADVLDALVFLDCPNVLSRARVARAARRHGRNGSPGPAAPAVKP